MQHRNYRLLSLLLALVLFWGAAPKAEAAEPKYLALTFDDGPSGRYTDRLLQGLAERNAKATFFLCGYRLEVYPDYPQKILSGGHEIGLHGYSHDPMNKLSPEALDRELEQTDSLLFEATGRHFSLLRPPGGQSTAAVEAAAAQRNLSLILWSVDPKDWATNDSSLIERRVLSNVSDGDIILLHDMSDSSVDAALSLVSKLQAEGYQFLTVSQLAALRGKPLCAGSLYTCLPGNFSPVS